MADTAARLALRAKRYEVLRFSIAVIGIDLTGVDMGMQVRLERGTPGAPLIALGTVTTASAEGLKLDSVTIADGVPTSVITGRINQSTMSDATKVPYAGEVGADTVLAYAIRWTLGGDARNRIEGDFIVGDSAFGSDSAPTARAAGYGNGARAVGGSETASLTFGDQVIQVSIADADLLGPIAAGVATALTEARTAADQAAAFAAVGIPLGTATVEQNNGSMTIYVVSVPGIDPAKAGARFSFVVPETSATTTIGIRYNGLGRDVFMTVGQKFNQGWTVTLGDNGDNRWKLLQQTPSGSSLTGVEDVAQTSARAVRIAAGVNTVLSPIAGNPNELSIDLGGLQNDDQFWAYVLVGNTEDNPRITMADGRRYAVTECPVGTLVPGNRVRIVFSGGINNFIYRERQKLPTLTDLVQGADDPSDLVAKFVRDFHAAQWATGNSAPIDFPITSVGSSVTTEISRDRAGATDYAPSHRLVDLLNGYAAKTNNLPGDARVPGTKAVDDNWSHGGHSVSQFNSQINESAIWAAGRAKAMFLAAGPNDFRVANYNTGQTLSGFSIVLESIIVRARDYGVPVFLATPFDPDVSQEDYGSFFTNNPTIPQSYPYDTAAPVNPETGMYPPKSRSVGVADMTGRGVLIPFDRRFDHGTAEIRRLAAKYPKVVVLIDSRKAFHRAVEELMPGAYGKRVLYGTGDPIHPLRYAHDRGFGVPLAELAQDILAGRPLKRVYEGRGGETDVVIRSPDADLLIAKFPKVIDARLIESSLATTGSAGSIAIKSIYVNSPTWVVDNGAAILPPKGQYNLALIEPIELVAGEVYEVVADFENAGSVVASAAPFFRLMDASYAAVGNAGSAPRRVNLNPGEKKAVRCRFGKGLGGAGGITLNLSDAVIHLRAGMLNNRMVDSDSTNPDAQLKLLSLYVRNVTDQVRDNGKNLFDPSKIQPRWGITTSGSVATLVTNSSSVRGGGFIPVTPGETYTISGTDIPSTGNVVGLWQTADPTTTGLVVTPSRDAARATFTVPEGYNFMYFRVAVGTNRSTDTTWDGTAKLEKNDIATPYQPYRP